MKRFICLLLLVIVFTVHSPAEIGVVHGEVQIAEENRVWNVEPGYCCWASLTMCCRHQGVKAGWDLLGSRMADPDVALEINGQTVTKNAGCAYTISEKLTSMGIKYRMVNRKSRAVQLIKWAITHNRPAMVCFQHGSPTTDGPHGVVVISFDEEAGEYHYIDPNQPFQYFIGKMSWFYQEVNGLVVVIDE